MLKDKEQKTIAEMVEAMAGILRENNINPMQAMPLVGYAARKVVSDIGRSVCLSEDYAVIISLGGMLPNEYLKALGSVGGSQPAKSCS